MTLDTRHPTLDTRHSTLDTRHSTLDTRHSTLDTRHSTPDTTHKPKRLAFRSIGMLAAFLLCACAATQAYKLGISYDRATASIRLHAPGDLPPDGIYDLYAADYPDGLSAGKAPWKLIQCGLEGPFENQEIIWTEPLPEPPAVRIYRLGRADIDRDDNAVADAREQLLDMYILPPESRSVWSRAGRSAGGDKTVYPVGAKSVSLAGDGVTDDSAALQAAIDALPENGALELPPGDYLLKQRIYMRPRTVLRGAGPDATRLLFEGPGTSSRCIGIVRWNSDQSYPFRSVSQAAQRGDTVIHLASVQDVVEGDIIELQQDNLPEWNLTDGWQAALEGQIGRVLSVNYSQNRLTLDRPLRFNIDLQRVPVARKLRTIDNVGIEDLYIEKRDAQEGHTIEMKYAVNCWVRNVESRHTAKAHVWMEYGFENEVRQSVFIGASNYGGGGHGYGVGCARHTSDCLIEDNIFKQLRHSMIVGIGANGNVYGYNYSSERMPDPDSGNLQADISVHGNYTFLNLFEGNVVEDADVPDWYYPAGPDNILFRNRIVNPGVAIEVASDRQCMIGNDLAMGTIQVADDVNEVTLNGNIEQGGVTWCSESPALLPDSIYRLLRPDFFGPAETGLPWPAIGPGCSTTDYFNPAHQRGS